MRSRERLMMDRHTLWRSPPGKYWVSCERGVDADLYVAIPVSFASRLRLGNGPHVSGDER